jgi:hypothetical protein
MKVKYTPGTPDNKVGKTYKVEIVGIEMRKAPFINYPVVSQVKIKYEDGKTEWVNGTKFYSDILDTKNVIRYTH